MAMVNMNNLLNGKDSRWLQLEVCREFQRNKCSRPDTECKFAHPPANVEVQNGRVTACYDSIKGRCNREKPPCKYFHPPQHLKDQLLINGRNHLALKNAIMQQMGLTPGQPLVPGQVPTVVDGATSFGLPLTLIPTMSLSLDEQCALMAANPYLTGMPQVGSTYSPYFAPGPIMPAIMGPDPSVASQLGVVPQTVVAQQKMPRSDRLEVCREFQRGACKRAESECRFAHPADTVTANEDGTVTVCMDSVMGRCNRDPCRYFHPPLHLQAHIKAAQSRASAPAAMSPLHQTLPAAAAAPLELGKKRPRDPSTTDTDLLLMDVKSVGSFYYENFAFPGMVPYKRPAADKSGMPVYQPSATTYQQLMQLQQPFVPVSCEYTSPPPSAVVTSLPSVSASSPVTSTITTHHHQEQPKLTAPHIPQQQSQPSQQEVEEPEPARAQSVSTSAVSAASLPPLPPHTVISVHSAPPTPVIHDPAALAKEVAQQNYAKAVKLAAVSNSFGINPLTALSYTGVALNKQTMPMPPPSAVPRYSTLPFNFGGAATPGLNIGMPNPYAAAHQAQAAAAAHAAAAQQQNLFTFSRPPPTLINPYSFLRPYAPSHHPQLLSQGLLAAAGQYQVSAAQSVQLQQAPVVSLAQTNNNNNVVLQPYKKMKTT